MAASCLLRVPEGPVCQGELQSPLGGQQGPQGSLTQPQQQEQEGGQHYPAVLPDQRVLSPAGRYEMRVGVEETTGGSPTLSLFPAKRAEGEWPGLPVPGPGPGGLKQGRVSPAAGIVGALGAVADGTKGPLGAADGCSARIPTVRVQCPVRGRGKVRKGIPCRWESYCCGRGRGRD